MTNVALLGYGRFGAAMASLLRDADVDVRAFDPRSPVPDEMRVASIPELVRDRDFVIVAVPVTAMPRAFAAMRPLLAPSQIVVDVGSVKLGPSAAMNESFGAAIPWVATHPLFGPISLSRGERPLVAVVCPNATHPAAVERVVALYERIGCTVVLEDEATHDRNMAWTHALAFFVAKGMLDAAVPLDIPYAPPSFQALARTVEAARSDAGHLYAALHRENPYAAEARRKLVEALVAADQNLSGSDGMAPPPSSSLVLLPSTARSQALRETRDLIDDLDREIVELLGRRAQLARRAAREKAKLGRPVRDPEREAELFEARRRWAAERGLDPASVHEIFDAILRFSRRLQHEEPIDEAD
ncbi:prephenate dehydrogenase/arogenate dehydrogenase family protein [Polyangium sorediatum]|uniref:chorismate mutase n=1 Tax=Polyangium sorediatum TaxID=889274 RepID=A0ABT6NZ75_9BACT|nr:prephenate dehydrogenase/arogenate dehydrogenase family protein [Polyangium sorediatum]MDI1433624.1 prephenate dehydrogenase/arogenate dehydrogenase family protein [Polyangium sorediatum]